MELMSGIIHTHTPFLYAVLTQLIVNNLNLLKPTKCQLTYNQSEFVMRSRVCFFTANHKACLTVLLQISFLSHLHGKELIILHTSFPCCNYNSRIALLSWWMVECTSVWGRFMNGWSVDWCPWDVHFLVYGTR